MQHFSVNFDKKCRILYQLLISESIKCAALRTCAIHEILTSELRTDMRCCNTHVLGMYILRNGLTAIERQWSKYGDVISHALINTPGSFQHSGCTNGRSWGNKLNMQRIYQYIYMYDMFTNTIGWVEETGIFKNWDCVRVFWKICIVSPVVHCFETDMRRNCVIDQNMGMYGNEMRRPWHVK